MDRLQLKRYIVRRCGQAFYGNVLSFKGERPAQSDALVAKNYCTEEELSALNSVVSPYLEFAEMTGTYMSDWIQALDGFLKCPSMKFQPMPERLVLKLRN